ncbi:MAG: ArnT family glycosyltransferase [Anaerolineaceae bacterium]
MLKKNQFEKLLKKVWMLIAGGLIVAYLANHLFSFWDHEAIWIILVFLVFSPLVARVLSVVLPKFGSAFQPMKRKQVLFIISAIILSFLATWLIYRAPVSYQTITLNPQVSQDQKVELVEIKVGGDVLPLEAKAVENNWSVTNGVLTATESSQPLKITFRISVNSKVSILFNSSPEGGNLSLSLGSIRKEVSLSTPSQQQKLVTFHGQYRNIPNWLFIPFLLISDSFTFFSLFLVIFILQEKGQQHFAENPHEKFFSKRKSLIILITLTSLLHLINALAVPLIVDSDSPAYLQGAVYLLKYGNLHGVSMFCGPGTTFLFAPVLYIFGRNPWGMKILLHLIALACVLISYRLGWQLSKKRWIAFSIGFLTMLIPDLYYYSNFIMSDLPNVFLVLLFSSLLLDALEDFRFPRILLALLVASFATLLRAENILILAIGTFCLGFQPGWDWLKSIFQKKKTKQNRNNLFSLGMLFLALFIALIPVLWLSYFNYEIHGFFGLNNSSGVVLYSGWVYYPEASGVDFRDETSLAVQEINYWVNKYPIDITDGSGIATPGEIYPSLIKAGYSSQEAFNIFEIAAWDSIFSHKELVPKILKLKLKDAFRSEIAHTMTFPLPGETTQPGKLYAEYFDPVTVSIPQFIILQRAFYDLFNGPASEIYRALVLLSLFTMFLSLYRKSFLKWVMLALLASTRIFIPNFMSVANWRYTVTGIPLLLIFGFISLIVLIYGAKDIFVHSKTEFS